MSPPEATAGLPGFWGLLDPPVSGREPGGCRDGLSFPSLKCLLPGRAPLEVPRHGNTTQ